MQEDFVRALEKLQDPDVEVRRRAARFLDRNIGWEGRPGKQFYPEVVDRLAKALSDSDYGVRQTVGIAIRNHNLTNFLGPAVPTMVAVLEHQSLDKQRYLMFSETARHTVAALAAFIEPDPARDTTPHLPLIVPVLIRSMEMIRTENRGDYGYCEFETSVIRGICNAAAQGTDIADAIPKLEHILSDRLQALSATWFSEVETNAKEVIGYSVGAMTSYYLNRGEREKAIDFLRGSNPRIAWSAQRDDQRFEGCCGSIDRLNLLEKAVEQQLLDMQGQNDAPKDPEALMERMEILQKLTYLVFAIAVRKALFAKKRDGELLVGESIPRPARDGKKIYRLLARRV